MGTYQCLKCGQPFNPNSGRCNLCGALRPSTNGVGGKA
jgi:DNA-directed RNA polymerase subunit RPC12/RpoP